MEELTPVVNKIRDISPVAANESIIEVPIIYSFTNIGETFELPRAVNIPITEDDVLTAMAGVNLKTIASENDINSAKSEIIKAIDTIAKEEKVKLKSQDKDKLANLTIMLLKRISERT